MRTLAITNGDLVISAGDFAMIEGNEEIAQSVRMTMETARGEWFLNPLFGMRREPFENKPYNEEEQRSAIIEAATDDDRIASVENLVFTFDRAARIQNIRLDLLKTNGENVTIEEVGI